jgi:hypothetical protein
MGPPVRQERRDSPVHATKRIAAATLLALALSLGLTGGVGAQQPATLDFTVTENRVPGADGAGTITPLPDGQLRVELRLTGLPPNGEHAAHFHVAEGARCDTNAPVVYPLTTVRVDGAGVGTSATTVTLRPEQPLRAGHAYLNVHQSPTGGPGVICANVDASFAAPAAPASPAAPAPGGGPMPSAISRTGTGLAADTPLAGARLAALLLGGLIGLAGVGTLATRAARRRRH